MTRRDTTESGFGAIEAMLIIVAIVVVAVAGLVLYRHNHKTNVKRDASTSTSQTASQQTTSSNAQVAQPAQQYLAIKEWGVELTLDSSTASLYYYMKPEVPDVAYLSLKTVSDIAPNCAADKVSLAAIGRLTEAQQQAAVSKPSILNRPGTIHIGSYWYSYTKPNSGCVDDAAQSDAVSKAQPTYNLEDVVRTLQATPTASSTN